MQRFSVKCPVPATVTLAVALTVLAPALCLLEARHVYRAGLFTVTLRTDRITSPIKVSSTDAPEIWEKKGAKVCHRASTFDTNRYTPHISLYMKMMHPFIKDNNH